VSSESVSGNKGAAQHEDNREGNSCFAKRSADPILVHDFFL
jgi:hypothetical protein